MEGAFFGSIIFEFIGAFTKWVFYSIQVQIKGGKSKRFIEIWMGRKNEKQEELILQGFSNIGLGMLVVLILLVIGTTFIT